MTGVRWREDVGFEGKCDYCRQWWPMERENWQPRSGMRRCRACWREYHRAHEAGRRTSDTIRSMVRSNARMGYWLNRPARLEAQRRWREANKEHVREYNRQWRERNRAKTREAARAYYDEARDVILLKKRAAYRERVA